MSDDTEVYIVGGCRTPIGSMGGSFKTTSAVELGTIVIKEALKRSTIKAEEVSEVIMGQVLTTGQGPNPARLAALKAGIPCTVPAYTVNMLCGSGLKSVYLGFQAIKNGDSSIVIAGGQECMSMAHHSTLMRNGLKYGHTELIDSILTDGLTDPNVHMHMGDTAEYLAQRHVVSRESQDEYAAQSQLKTGLAKEHGFFDAEIVPVPCKDGKLEFTLSEDEFPKPDTTVERLSKLRPCFKGGKERSVTAGNSSGLNDGAAAVVLCTEKIMHKLKDVIPLGKIAGFSQIGLEPENMGIGPIQAIRSLVYRINWRLEEIDLFEVNEAFAVQAIIVAKELRIPEEKWNISGGAIALGHPIGCSGTRVLLTLLYNLRRLNKKRGIAALCIGGGMGIAVAVERV